MVATKRRCAHAVALLSSPDAGLHQAPCLASGPGGCTRGDRGFPGSYSAPGTGPSAPGHQGSELCCGQHCRGLRPLEPQRVPPLHRGCPRLDERAGSPPSPRDRRRRPRHESPRSTLRGRGGHSTDADLTDAGCSTADGRRHQRHAHQRTAGRRSRHTVIATPIRRSPHGNLTGRAPTILRGAGPVTPLRVQAVAPSGHCKLRPSRVHAVARSGRCKFTPLTVHAVDPSRR